MPPIFQERFHYPKEETPTYMETPKKYLRLNPHEMHPKPKLRLVTSKNTSQCKLPTKCITKKTTLNISRKESFHPIYAQCCTNRSHRSAGRPPPANRRSAAGPAATRPLARPAAAGTARASAAFNHLADTNIRIPQNDHRNIPETILLQLHTLGLQL